MKAEVKRVGKSQLEITITVPSNRVGEVSEKVLADAAKEIEIKGFRKGQAPKEMVREKVDKQRVYDEAISRIVAESYNAAVKEHLLKPIVNPRVEIIQFEPESQKDFIFKATAAERPEVNLGDYKKELTKFKVQKPAEGIVGPDGKPIKPTSEPSEPLPRSDAERLLRGSLDAVLQTILKTAAVEIPEILTEGEVNRMLSRLVDQTARLGLTIEQYLQSQNKTADQLRAEYAKQAEENLKAELVLDELAEVENIEVSEKEIEEAIKANPDPEARKQFAKEENRWYIRSILKRNKTIQRLVELAK